MAKYTQSKIDDMGKKGQAFGPDQDGHYSYPIGDTADLANAIHAVGRGNADHDKLRKYIMGRAEDLGAKDQIPDNWNADGSLRSQDSDPTSPLDTLRADPEGFVAKMDRNDPTPEDADVTALLLEAKNVLDKLKAAQAKDPDADDPDDQAVSKAIDKAAGALDTAGVAQAADNAPEPRRKQRHRSKVAADEYRRSVGREVRLYGIRGGLEVRGGKGADSHLVEITGQPIVYNQPYSVRDMLGEFQETMKPGVCANVLTTADTRFLFNHDGMPLARTTSGTLRLDDTPDALSFSAFLDTRQQLANDLVIAIERGDISQMSVGFVVADDSWSDDWTERSIHRFEELLDVSAVTYPASPTTTIDIANRMLMEIPVESRARVRKLVGEIRSGKALSEQNKDHLTQAANALASILDDHGLPQGVAGIDGTQNGPVNDPSSAQDGTGSRTARSCSRLRLEMDLMEFKRRKSA